MFCVKFQQNALSQNQSINYLSLSFFLFIFCVFTASCQTETLLASKATLTCGATMSSELASGLTVSWVITTGLFVSWAITEPEIRGPTRGNDCSARACAPCKYKQESSHQKLTHVTVYCMTEQESIPVGCVPTAP